MQAECQRRGICVEDIPSIEELQRRASLVFKNGVRSLENPPVAHSPNVVHIGGIHCRPSEPLPEALEAWVQRSGRDGFIFFSLGSIAETADIPQEKKKILFSVFGSLKQRVLLKWNIERENVKLPPNVRAEKWLPQQDILGHQKLRLFITHGGLLSLQEATYHSVPILGMPLFADQHSNVFKADAEGWAHLISWNDLQEDTFAAVIHDMLQDQRMRSLVAHRSQLMRDEPTTPKERVVFWTEYVTRHNGAPHLRSPIGIMPWYKMYNVDVWTTLLVAATGLTYLVFRLGRWVFYYCCISKKEKEK